MSKAKNIIVKCPDSIIAETSSRKLPDKSNGRRSTKSKQRTAKGQTQAANRSVTCTNYICYQLSSQFLQDAASFYHRLGSRSNEYLSRQTAAVLMHVVLFESTCLVGRRECSVEFSASWTNQVC